MAYFIEIKSYAVFSSKKVVHTWGMLVGKIKSYLPTWLLAQCENRQRWIGHWWQHGASGNSNTIYWQHLP